MAEALKAAYRATCKIIHPDKCTDPNANKAQVMVNAAMTTLESPFARSSYNTAFERKLQQHEQQVLKRRRKQQIAQDLGKKAAAIAQKTKKPATSASGSAKGASSSTTAQASTNDKASAQKPKEMQQEQHASKEPSVTKPSKTEAKTSKAGEEKTETKEPAKTEEKSSPKWWDVGGFQVKQFKHWITVRLERGSIRKLLFKEWQDEQVAKEVATQFAKQASRKMTEFQLVKTKKLKAEFLTTNGINGMTGKETVVQLEGLLEEACFVVDEKGIQTDVVLPQKEKQRLYIFLVVKGLAVPVTKSLQVLFSMI